LLLPRTVRTADPPEGPAFLSVRLFPQISRSMQSWNGQVEPGVARAVMADLDERMATLPRRPEEALGCLHSLTGAVWRARGVERTLQDVDFCQADGQALWPVYQRLFDQILETEGCESRWRDPRGQVREVMRCLRLRGDRRQAFAVLKASEALTAPLEGDEETPRRIFVDRDVFADEGMAVVSGRWSVALDVGESDERPFIESWSLQRNGIWRLEQRRGSAPGEGVARR
ncbi:MAG TPA: hypothetical protein VGB49_09590, partial [Caulobacteraceae bacterium]